MAVVVNKKAEIGQKLIRSVRIMLDPVKTAQYPRLHECMTVTNLKKIERSE